MRERIRLTASRLGSHRFGGALLIANTLGLILLVFGALGLSAYRDGLLEARADVVERQAVLARAALSGERFGGCGGGACLDDAAGASAILGAASTGFDGRLLLFRQSEIGAVVVAATGSRRSGDPAAVPIPLELPRQSLPGPAGKAAAGILDNLLFRLPIRDRITDTALDEEAAEILARREEPGTRMRYSADGKLLLSASQPIFDDGRLAGVVIAESAPIDPVSRKIRQAVLPVTVLTFVLASFFALVLTAAVTQPLRQLSIAADRVRSSVGRAAGVRLPDFDHRQDDVGRLSRSFRTMTKALVDRIESIDSFAADVSHELKNPLTSIKSAVETLDRCRTDEQRRRLLEVIANDVERMDRLISDISAASRLDAQLATETRELLSASTLARDVAGSYRAVTEAGGPRINFWDDTTGETVIFGAPAALGRVLRNLIDNAVSFSPPSGAVTVAVEKDSRTQQESVMITVTDEGPGVPPDNLESIFSRFYTSRPEGTTFGSNSGLGLAIARQIVESHGGRIWCENVAGSFDDGRTGARFSVQLPLHQGGPV